MGCEFVKYKIFYHLGDELSSKTRVKTGFLIISEENLYLTESNSHIKSINNIVRVELAKIPGGGHCIKIYCNDCILYISVIRFCLFGSFVLVNYHKTIEVYKKLERLLLGK